MKVSELIVELQKVIEMYGDLPVYRADYEATEDVAVDDVSHEWACTSVFDGVRMIIPERIVVDG